MVVKSASFSRDDWVRMKVYGAFVRALHNFGLTRLVALYLHFGHAVPYRTVYDALIDEHFGTTEVSRTLVDHFRTFLVEPSAVADIEFERFPDLRVHLEPGRWVFVRLALDADRYFDGLTAFLTTRFPNATNLRSALDFQRQVLAVPPGTTAPDRAVPMTHDWIGYFERARRLTSHAPLGEPDPVPADRVAVAAETTIADPAGDEQSRWLAWLRGSREVRRTLGYYRELRWQKGTA